VRFVRKARNGLCVKVLGEVSGRALDCGAPFLPLSSNQLKQPHDCVRYPSGEGAAVLSVAYERLRRSRASARSRIARNDFPCAGSPGLLRGSVHHLPVMLVARRASPNGGAKQHPTCCNRVALTYKARAYAASVRALSLLCCLHQVVHGCLTVAGVAHADAPPCRGRNVAKAYGAGWYIKLVRRPLDTRLKPANIYKHTKAAGVKILNESVMTIRPAKSSRGLF